MSEPPTDEPSNADAPKPGDAPKAGDTPHTGDTKRASLGSNIVWFLLALGIGFAIPQLLRRGDEAEFNLEQGPRYKVALRGDEPQLGPDDALVTIVEFADYECPFCARAKPPLDEVLEDFEGDVRLIYKHYPLPSHDRAEPAARAAWAAHQQGKFWPVHAYLFEHGADVSKLPVDAGKLGLDAQRLLADMRSEAAAQAVDDDAFAAGKLGVTGTPVFFVNGHRYVGLKDANQWEQIVEAELAVARELVDRGTPRSGVLDELLEGALESARAAKDDDSNRLVRVPIDGRPSMGPPDALVTVVVFSDFQCPFCRRAAPELTALVKERDDMRLVFRQLPLPMHDRAEDAAKAALAAERQGKFWEMHDAIFALDDLGEADFADVARELELDVERFQADMASSDIASRVAEDKALARAIGVNGTPTLVINGRTAKVGPKAAMVAKLDAARAEAQALVDAGTPRHNVYDALLARADQAEAP